MNLPNNKRVVVALSGGVDSSVAACLLKDQGYEVIGISLKVWDEEGKGHQKTCCSFTDIQDARKVCGKLRIPFYAFNYKKEFEKHVIYPFVASYYQGRTPNPCILCNQHIKFDQLLKEAQKLGANYLATGHHARIVTDENGICHLMKGKDGQKDQSYVLYNLTQAQLQRLLFPVGDYKKNEVRKLATSYGLSTAFKQESQDICFIPDRDHARFIEEHFPRSKIKKGFFVDSKGHQLGEHQGIYKYTVGQRRGLGIGFGERMYVTKIDSERNEVFLGPVDELLSTGLVATEMNWIVTNGVTPFGRGNRASVEYGVKIRYQKDEIPSSIESDGCGKVSVRFLKNSRLAVTPGQSAVFYKGEEVMGGGVIESAM